MTTIMIVEDEPMIRHMGAEILADAGYDVIEAEDAGDALSVLEQRRDVKLLFTDVRMPGAMDGLELAERVHDRWPKIRLLVTSGHTRLSNAEVPDAGEFMPKPYNWRDLQVRVERMLSTVH